MKKKQWEKDLDKKARDEFKPTVYQFVSGFRDGKQKQLTESVFSYGNDISPENVKEKRMFFLGEMCACSCIMRYINDKAKAEKNGKHPPHGSGRR